MLLRSGIGEETRGRIWAGFGGDCTFSGNGEGGGDKDNLPSPLEIRLTANALPNAASLKCWKGSWVEPALLDIFLPCHEQDARANEEERTIHVTCGRIN